MTELHVGQRVTYRDHLGAYEDGTIVSLSDPDHPVVDFDRYGHQIMERDMIRPFVAPERRSAGGES